MLLRAILAAAFGTVAMTLSSTTEMQWVGRPASVAPGLAFARLLSFVGVPEIKARALDILATWVHPLYGAWWGVVFWLLIGVAGLPLAATGVRSSSWCGRPSRSSSRCSVWHRRGGPGARRPCSPTCVTTWSTSAARSWAGC